MNEYTRKMKYFAEQSSENKIMMYFYGADLRCGHIGLTELAKKKKIHVNQLKGGEFLIFSNLKQTRFKLLGPNGVLVYLKPDSSDKIEMEAISMLPRLFNGTDFNYRAAAKLGFKKAA